MFEASLHPAKLGGGDTTKTVSYVFFPSRSPDDEVQCGVQGRRASWAAGRNRRGRDIPNYMRLHALGPDNMVGRMQEFRLFHASV